MHAVGISMKIQSCSFWCLLLLGALLPIATPSLSAQDGADQATVDLTGPDSLIAPATHLEELPEELPPAANHAVASVLPDPRAPDSYSELRPMFAPHGFDGLAPWHDLRIWNVPYGVWVLSNEMEQPQPIRHADPTGLAPVCFSSLHAEGEITLYFARSSLDLYDPTQRFEAKVRLVSNQTVDFDFARAGGNTGYGNMVKTNLLVDLPKPAKESIHALPVAAPANVAPTIQPERNDGDPISNLIRCRDLDPSVFSDRLRISFASNLVVLPAEALTNVRLCQIAIEDSDRQRLTDKWTLHGKLEVDAPGGPFVLTKESSDRFELDVDVASLPTSNDPKHKVLVLKETGLSLQVKLQNPLLTDNTIYQHPLSAYLIRLGNAAEGTIRLTDVKLKLNGVKLDDACTADVSEIQIRFVNE